MVAERRKKIRGTTLQLDAELGLEGLLAYDMDREDLRIYDGILLGGRRIPNTESIIDGSVSPDRLSLDGAYTADCNLAVASGFYRTNAATVNQGVAAGIGSLLVMPYQDAADGDVFQVWFATTTSFWMYVRGRLNGVWSAWFKIFENVGNVIPSGSIYTLGTGTLGFTTLFLTSLGIINIGNGAMTATHSASLFTLAGGSFSVSNGGVFVNRTLDVPAILMSMNRTSGVAGFAGFAIGSTGAYGFLDYDTSSTNGVRLSALGPLRFGSNTNAAYGSSVFTEAARVDQTTGRFIAGGTGATQVAQAGLHVGPGSETPAFTVANGTLIAVQANGDANISVRNNTADSELSLTAHSAGSSIGTPTVHDLFIRTNATNRLTITSAGVSTFLFGLSVTGLLDLSAASSGQIKFPATQNPSANANTFDDYEEGTWTPTMSFGGSSAGITYNSPGAQYTKLGHRVFFDIQMSLSNNGSGSGTALVLGLPYTVGGIQAICYGLPQTMVALTSGLMGTIANGNTQVQLVTPTATTITVLTEANVPDTAIFRLAGSYLV